MMLRTRLQPTLSRRALHVSAPASAGPRVPAGAAKAKATIQPTTQSASLASGVLLGTQRNWKSETVVTLKAELKRRGLSQQGNKTTLVERLRNAEASASLVPPTPATAPGSRRLSTTAPAKADAAPAEKARNPSPASAPEAEHVSTAAGDKVVETPVLAHARELSPEARVSPPGIPLKPTTKAKAFDIKFPAPTPEREIPQIIPTIPSNFKKASSEKPKPTIKKTGPQVVTVASAATHPAGGPVSPAAKVEDSYALEFDDPSVLTLDQQVEGAVAAAAEAVSNLVDVNLPPAPSAKESTYVANSEPLTAEERSGAWILAAGLGAALLVAGLNNPKPKKEKKEEGKETDEPEAKKN